MPSAAVCRTFVDRAAVAVEGATAALTRLRRARLLHPLGRSFTGEVTVWGAAGPPTGVTLLDRPGRYPATVRLSKGVPTPANWPDVLGLAVRLHRGAERPFDLLVSSSCAAPVLRHLPLPRRRFAGTYSTIMSYRTGRGRLYLAALADPESVDLGRDLAEVTAATRADCPRLVLAVASAVGPWRPFGQVSLGDQLSAQEDAELAFDPVDNLPAGLRMVGPLAWLRDHTYRASRRTRGAAAQSGGSLGVTV
ncbi:phosphodiesterase [Micromonospora deserti]|uniref:Phosphodiesterase n=1 Tax=Micromonospora deserti TaxID=2070366 RepID=A0A2W2BN22_9ACTN|nr:phosphodiesterase [Micromonospora deserti]PZF87462.1 phosphodiesterase [Micromonospora deserti]